MSRFFNRSNKSSASLDKIQDQTRDRSPNLREPSRPQQPLSQQAQHSEAEGPLYQQSQPGQRGSGIYRPAQEQTYTIHSSQQAPQDERYYNDNPTHLSRSSSTHQPTIYAEQQQLQQQQQRPTISLVNPTLQQQSIAENDSSAGPTQFGPSTRLRTSGAKEKEEKKSRNSGIRSLFGGSKEKKEGRDTSSESSRLSRHSSILNKRQPAPTSPSGLQNTQASPQVPQSPQQSLSESIGTYQSQSFQAPSQEDVREEEQTRYEQYYRPRPNSQYAPPSQQERRPSIQYEEDAPQFPAPPQAQQYQQQHLYHQPNVSQPHIDLSTDVRKDHFAYISQPIRDQPSALFEPDQSLRPPSQSSLGPPSPLGAPSQLASRQPTSNPPRYSVQAAQTYQAAQQAANQQTQSQQVQAQTPHQSQQTHGDNQSLQERGMPNRDRDRQQRDSRMEEQDLRYQVQDPRARMSTATANDQGRSTPPPRGRDDAQTLDHQTLLQRYEELQAKYSKVKRYYFDREAQVTQLQNVVANQRLSMSKTSLDDAQYANRFERLSGAIQNLAFNIRKDWRRLPNWLAPACNRDACATGTKEMTAVGRACISRWLFEHIFQTVFHPGIDERLSHELKSMDRALRRSPSVLTEEQRDDLLTKVTTWRLTTCEALSEVLHSRQSEAHTEALSRRLADELCAYLHSLLNVPAPPNLEGYLQPIVAQALSISANLPLESRDICIDYYYPGTPMNETFMKLETGMTPLVQPGSAPNREDYEETVDDDDTARSMNSENDVDVQEQIREGVRAAATSSNNTITSTGSKDSKHKAKGFFSGGFSGGLVSNKKTPSASSGRGPSQTDLLSKGDGDKNKEDDHAWNFDAMVRGQKEGKIRFAVFLAVEVRGKSLKLQEGSQSGNGNGGDKGDIKSAQQAGAISAGPGVAAASGTSGGAGTGGVNVLVKAPVFGF
ncbi:hypothetical protein LTR05_001830 [Lithohypha guttulata]|uniref:Uncharacterized protein n=1 Tax=Lithohypha guttulata TaxID=1690604 RepID=A0AAN7T8B4_9EURO|nr:hypothetical protein LTR05_001830 [Lithohypha guttulata]